MLLPNHYRRPAGRQQQGERRPLPLHLPRRPRRRGSRRPARTRHPSHHALSPHQPHGAPSFAPSPRLSRSSTVSDLSASSQGEYLVLHCACSYSTTDRPWIGGRRPDRLAADQGCSTVTLQNGPKNSTLDGHILCWEYAARDAASNAASQPSRSSAQPACPVCLSLSIRDAPIYALALECRVSLPKCPRPAADAFFPKFTPLTILITLSSFLPFPTHLSASILSLIASFLVVLSLHICTLHTSPFASDTL